MALSPAVVAAVAFVLLALMFGLGATMKDADIVAVSRRPKGIAVGLASQFVYMPFLAYIMAVSAGWSDGTSIQKLYALTLILQVSKGREGGGGGGKEGMGGGERNRGGGARDRTRRTREHVLVMLALLQLHCYYVFYPVPHPTPSLTHSLSPSPP